jgi:uncharacterized membrane protein (UPF0127 family)
MRAFFIALLLCIGVSLDASAQPFRQREPLDPAKAQSLPFTPMTLKTDRGTFELQVEVADDDRERAIGMMHRSEVPINKGMLFDMKRTDVVSFWMRNTYIPLDMIFIDRDGVVQTIAANTIPHNETGVSSRVPVYAVLELQGGACEYYGLQPGDKITHAIFKK